MKILTFILLFSLSDNPPGTIKVKNYYVDQTEILNIHWLEYLHHKGEELDSTEILKLLPDSANGWYAIPANRYKPIVMITYEQAIDYCAWRSNVVSERIGKKVTYRLPSMAEWQAIAEEVIKTDLKQQEKDLKETKERIEKDAGEYLLIDREKTKSRVYDLFDNVTEMTQDKGVAMGANNYELTDLEANIKRWVKYDSPNAYLGFRCVAEME
jgi:formylglycine-generating enzyme required for sulfatase activity